MKRNQLALVSYSSSDDEKSPVIPTPAKKRKLPTLSSSLTPQTPVDDPTLHQGRIRTTPHVEGQFAAYIYVALFLEPSSALFALVEDVLAFANKNVAALYEIGTTYNSEQKSDVKGTAVPKQTKGTRELHISLSQPIYVRAHQREDLKRAVKSVAKNNAPFMASFAAFSELMNDERTRTFLTMEVGAGYSEFRALAEALTPTLRAIRQREYYAEPRFHASIAWALLELRQTTPSRNDTTAEHASIGNSISASPSDQDSLSPASTAQFAMIPHLPTMLIPALTEQYVTRLSSMKVGAFEVNHIYVKIGKDVHKWRLSAP